MMTRRTALRRVGLLSVFAAGAWPGSQRADDAPGADAPDTDADEAEIPQHQVVPAAAPADQAAARALVPPARTGRSRSPAERTDDPPGDPDHLHADDRAEEAPPRGAAVG